MLQRMAFVRRQRVTLVKVVLEAIPVYWFSMAYIPKSIIDKVSKPWFKFLWEVGKQKGVPLVS